MRNGAMISAGAAVLALLATACGGGGKPEPDRVVGVVMKCQIPAHSAPAGLPRVNEPRSVPTAAPGIIPAQDLTGDGCNEFTVNRRQEVTVRTSAGGSYVVTADASATVTVGQEWPPK